MGELLQNLQDVYARWERSPASSPGVAGGGGGGGGMDQRASDNYERLVNRGRKAWKERFGDYKRPVRKNNYKKKTSQPTYDPLSSLGEFKHQPILQPCHVIRYRPMMGRCCECLVVSKKNFYTDSTPLAGFRDVLRVQQARSNNNLFVRSFCHVIHTLSRDTSHQYPDVISDVITSMRVEEAIERTAAQRCGHDLSGPVDPRMDSSFEDVCKDCRREVVRTVNRMKASMSNWLIRLTGWVLMKILGRLLKALVIHQGQMAMVKKAYKRNKNVPLVFLPLHRSHLDYIILTFVLWNFDVQAPFVAAGDNLSIPFFGSLLKGLGGFFIRRKLDRETGKRDLLYRAVLHQYMGEVLRCGQNLEFFLEGGRSRSGRVLHPKAGLLSVVTETFVEGTIPDAYLVPVSISYERIVDGNFTREQMGESKQKETFWRAIRAILRVLMTNFGNVRVDLGQPFSLQEYYSLVQHSSHAHDDPNSQSEGRLDHRDKLRQSGGRSGSDTSLYGTDVIAEDQRNVVLALAEHVVYNSMKTTAVMSTNLVAYLLMTKFRQGTTFSELVMNVDWLREEITCRGRDVGFSGNSCDVIRHALGILGEKLVRITKSKEVDDYDIVPCLALPDVFELSYYANVTGMVFIMESLMATAILAASEDDLTVCSDERVSVSKDAIMNNAEFLATLLKYEFVLAPPCTTMQMTLVDTMETFIGKQLLIRNEDSPTDSRSRRTAQSYAFQSDSDSDEDNDAIHADEQLEVECGSAEFVLWYPFLWMGLAPVMEAYWVAACSLNKLLEQDMQESQFITLVHKVAKQRVLDGMASFAESMAYDTIKNALLSYQRMKIIEIYSINGLRMVSLCDSYTCSDALNELAARVEKFRL